MSILEIVPNLSRLGYFGHGVLGKWCRNQDSNSGPDDYKSTALPTELLRRTP